MFLDGFKNNKNVKINVTRNSMFALTDFFVTKSCAKISADVERRASRGPSATYELLVDTWFRASVSELVHGQIMFHWCA